MGQKFIVHGRLWGLNDYVNTCKARYGQKATAAYKRKVEEDIGWCVRKYIGNWHTEKKVYLKFKWVEPNRKRDKDNIAFGKKFIQDALVKSGVINNDGWEYVVGFEDSFAVDKDNPRIEVEIIEVD